MSIKSVSNRINGFPSEVRNVASAGNISIPVSNTIGWTQLSTGFYQFTTRQVYGGTETEDENYFYNTFLSTASLTVYKNSIIDYLIVAGGGSGGCSGISGCGGGGGGGLRNGTVLSLTSNTYTVTVGDGGTATVVNNPGNKGGDSVFNGITATGGAGGRTGEGIGYDGGCGGGAQSAGSTNAGGAGNTPSTDPIQGYNGGSATSDDYQTGGGGGGAGGVGGNGTAGVGGNGGVGKASSISGTEIYYGGGGGGGADNRRAHTPGTGTNGGGNANDGGVGGSGTANRGCGGGAGTSTGGAGGSGIVIVRIAK